MTVEDGTNTLAGSFTDDPVPLSRDDLEEMANACMFVKDHPLVVDLTTDKELGLDDEGNGNGNGAGCMGDMYSWKWLSNAKRRGV